MSSRPGWTTLKAAGCLAMLAVPPLAFGAFMLMLAAHDGDWNIINMGGNSALLEILSVPFLVAAIVVLFFRPPEDPPADGDLTPPPLQRRHRRQRRRRDLPPRN